MLHSEEATPDADLAPVDFKEENVDQSKVYQLLDPSETLLISDAAELADKLGIKHDQEVYVCCIVGRVGDGKSHTLNEAFLNKKRVFETSKTQNSCTKGVWAAYNAGDNCIFLDTEGLSASNDTSNLRLLLKVIAISDVVIYQTRSSLLHDDMSAFLRNAFSAFSEHFLVELRKHKCVVNEKVPSVIIFHETQHKEPLESNDKLRESLGDWRFTLPDYVGIKDFTDFNLLQSKFRDMIYRTACRQPHQLHVLLGALKILNKRFAGEVKKAPLSLFTETCLRCEETCLACSSRCKLSGGHIGESHQCETSCSKVEHLQNAVYLCKACYEADKEFQLLPANDSSLLQYAWSGVSLKCSNSECKVEYQSRKYLYGNPTPEEAGVALLQVRHVWRNSPYPLINYDNMFRRLVDKISPQTRSLGEHVMDKVNPPEWIPNSKIKECAKCLKAFAVGEHKHHCRVCGMGFCDACSSKRRKVPERGYQGEERVCDSCYSESQPTNTAEEEQVDNRVRSITSSVTDVFWKAVEYPKARVADILKEAIRPSYWVRDSDAPHCDLCKTSFSDTSRHHCRSCGRAFCDPCSRHELPVPAMGWPEPTRVCNGCEPLLRVAVADTSQSDKK